MDAVRLISVKEEIMCGNRNTAELIRRRLTGQGVFMLNLMASPGAGKTSLILETIHRLRNQYRIAVIEGDIDSQVDADRIAAEGIPAVQLQTGGSCHLDAPMIRAALKTLDLEALDLIIIENIGNLVCPAEFDTGAHSRALILSVPEGDDKIIKYPLIFSIADALVVNKIDYLTGPGSDFSMERLSERAPRLNPSMRIFPVSCRSSDGLDQWCAWLDSSITRFREGVC